MIKIEISGATREEILQNFALTAALLGAGEVPNAAPETAPGPVIEGEVLAPAPEEPAKAKRGRKKSEEPTEVQSKPQPEPEPGSEEPAAETAPKIEKSALQDRVRAIIKQQMEEGRSQAEAIAHVEKLFAKFGITKLGELDEARYGEFLKTAEKF